MACIHHILFQNKVEYVIDINLPPPPPKRSYETYKEENRTTRDIILTAVEPHIEILFEEYEYNKNMFVTIFYAYGPSYATHF